MSKENLSFKRKISLVALGVKCQKVANTGKAAVECNPLSSRKSSRLQGLSGISLNPDILKTSESSSEKFGENPGDEQTVQVRREKISHEY